MGEGGDAIKKLEDRIAELEAKLAELRQAHADELEAKLAELRQAHADELEARDATIADLRAQEKEYIATIAARDATIEALERALAERDAALAERDATIANLQADEKELRATLAAHDAKIKELEAKLASLEADLAASNQSALAIRELREQIEKLVNELAERDAQHQSALAEAQQRIADLTAQLAELRDRLDLRDNQLSDKEMELANALVEIEKLKRSIADLESRLVDLGAELERAKKEAAEAMEEARAKWGEEKEALIEVRPRARASAGLSFCWPSFATLRPLPHRPCRRRKTSRACNASSHALTLTHTRALPSTSIEQEINRLKNHLNARKETLKQRWTSTIIKLDANFLSSEDERNIAVEYGVDTLELLISQMYHEKILADIADDNDESSERQTLDEFTLDYFTFKFGVRAIAERHLSSLYDAIEQYADQSTKVSMFGSFCGHPACPPVAPQAIHTHLFFLAQIWRAGVPASEFKTARTVVPYNVLTEAVGETLSEHVEADVLAGVLETLDEKRGIAFDEPSRKGELGVNLDDAAKVILDLWSSLKDAFDDSLREHFHTADENSDGVLTFSEFTTVVTALRPEMTTRGVKGLFRQAQRKCLDGNTIDIEAFSSIALDSKLAFLPVRQPPNIQGRENYIERRLLEDSWAGYSEVLHATLGLISEEEASGNLRRAIESIEGHLKEGSGFQVRFAGAGAGELQGQSGGSRPNTPGASSGARIAAPAWTMYRRCLLLHYVQRERMELKHVESRRAEMGAAAFATKFND